MKTAPEFNNTQAFSEGWGIFYVDGLSSHVPFQLQGLCNEEEFEGDLPFYEDDEGAWRFVVEKANAGSAYHQSALEYLAEHSAEEWADFTHRFPVTYSAAA